MAGSMGGKSRGGKRSKSKEPKINKRPGATSAGRAIKSLKKTGKRRPTSTIPF